MRDNGVPLSSLFENLSIDAEFHRLGRSTSERIGGMPKVSAISGPAASDVVVVLRPDLRALELNDSGN